MQTYGPMRYAQPMTSVETRFGTVDIGPDWIGITAHGGQLWQWANRTGSMWPCSELADLDGITVGFDTNGLVECEEDPAPSIDDDGISSSSLMGDELSAWSSDVLRTAGLDPNHPCHFVCVGQYIG